MTRILVIEDEINVRETIAEILSLKGYDVVTAVNGRDGIVQAMEHRPDAIVCDVMMPELNGFEVLDTVRKHESLMATPFLFLTAKVERTSMRLGMRGGADDYITKPFSSAELIEAIETRLTRARTMREQAQERLRELQTAYDRAEIHEINTPLNGILGGTELLLTSWATLTEDERFELMEMILHSGRRLHHTMSNYFLYKELENQDLDEPMPVGTPTTLTGSESLIAAKASEAAAAYGRGADLFVELEPAPPIVFICEHLQRVIGELIDNACKFSARGTEIHCRGWQEDGCYRVSISDHGRGMSREQLDSIGPFRQFDRQRFEQQGTGLGLHLSRTLLQRCGGDLNVSSVPGEGTTVSVAFPISR